MAMYMGIGRVCLGVIVVGVIVVGVIVVGVIVVGGSLVAELFAQGELGREEGEVEVVLQDGKTVGQWIGDWDAGNFRQTQTANKALAKFGKTAVPALAALIRDNHRHAGYAMQALGEMGDDARPALPEIVKVAQNKQLKDPEGWTWNMPVRAILLMNVHKMSWASEELVPLLTDVGNDEEETAQLRQTAVHALRGMGPNALPSLRKFVITGTPKIRESAVNSMVTIQAENGKTKVDALQEVIDSNPFDANVPTYLVNMKGAYNIGKLHAPTQRIKELYRQELEKKPDSEIAWQLARLIRNGLANTDRMWAAPSNSYRTRWMREDPNENYETLAAALTIAHSHSERDSEMWKKSGLSLAKLRLLQGDWEGMNQALVELGQAPVPAERRPNLPPPPLDWDNLEQSWQPADESVRNGTSGIEFRFLRRGAGLQGVAGVHVLVKDRPQPEVGFRSGINANTLFYATQPMLEKPFDSFGYRGGDRTKARYAVSNEKGIVRLEGLPPGPVLVEILLPTANFSEFGYSWDLMMTTPDGVKVADASDRQSVDSSKPPAAVELEDGVVTRYPIMFVRSQLTTTLNDWQPVDKDDFVLTWNGLSYTDVEHYNVKLSLSAPAQHPSMVNSTPIVATHTEKVTGTSWPVGKRGVGKRGVGKLRLVPGNFYLVEVDAISGGTVAATLSKRRFWVPWEHRDSEPPLLGSGAVGPAFYHDIFLRTSVNGSPLEERLPNLIKNSANQFETEYYRLGMAWLDLHKGKETAEEQLEALVKELPAGNVVRETAQSLLDAAAKGEALPRRLKFVGE